MSTERLGPESQALALSAMRILGQAGRFAFTSLCPGLIFDEVNPGFTEIVGRESEPFKGRRLAEVLGEFAGSETALAAVANGEQADFRLDNVSHEMPDGRTRYLRYQVAPIDERAPSRGLLLLVGDISDQVSLHQELIDEHNELRLAQKSLAEANRTLQRLNRLKSLFLSMAAHEMRAPLSNISSFAELMQDEMEEDRRREFLGIIISQSDRLRRLINDVVDLDMIEQGRLEVDPVLCSLDDVVREVILVQGPAMVAGNLALKVDMPAEQLCLRADPERLGQIVYNLVENAVKYTSEGGQLRVAARREADQVVLTVADNGQGMTAEQVERLFTLYYRAAKSGRSRVSGTGLGLFIVKTLVEAHGGEISVNSQPEVGTEFTVRLPSGGDLEAE